MERYKNTRQKTRAQRIQNTENKKNRHNRESVIQSDSSGMSVVQQKKKKKIHEQTLIQEF